MKFLMAIILTAAVAFFGSLYIDWWIIAIAAFIIALLVHQKQFKAFLAGFLGIFLLWAGLSFWIDIKNESILSSRIGELLGVGQHPIALVLITGLVGGLVGGFAAWCGSALRSSRR